MIGNNSTDQLKMTAYASLLAALTAVGAYIAIPIGPVPIVLQNLFVYLMGLLLGSRWGLAGMGAYLLAGAVGLPVFSGGKGGLGHLIGPTGGYLIGFVPAVAIIGIITEKTGGKLVFGLLALILATAVIYACGVSWLSIVTNMTLAKSLIVGMVPFLPGDIVKIIAALFIARTLRPMLRSN
jgi:biotin transport system substrate-specific component